MKGADGMNQNSSTFNVTDTHCDVLLKLWMNPNQSFKDSDQLDVTLTRLMDGGVTLQCFAIFIEPFVKQELKFQAVLEQIQLFHQKVIQPYHQMKHVKKWSDLFIKGRRNWCHSNTRGDGRRWIRRVETSFSD